MDKSRLCDGFFYLIKRSLFQLRQKLKKELFSVRNIKISSEAFLEFFAWFV